jgi:hypothetical protein
VDAALTIILKAPLFTFCSPFYFRLIQTIGSVGKLICGSRSVRP